MNGRTNLVVLAALTLALSACAAAPPAGSGMGSGPSMGAIDPSTWDVRPIADVKGLPLEAYALSDGRLAVVYGYVNTLGVAVGSAGTWTLISVGDQTQSYRDVRLAFDGSRQLLATFPDGEAVIMDLTNGEVSLAPFGGGAVLALGFDRDAQPHIVARRGEPCRTEHWRAGETTVLGDLCADVAVIAADGTAHAAGDGRYVTDPPSAEQLLPDEFEPAAMAVAPDGSVHMVDVRDQHALDYVSSTTEWSVESIGYPGRVSGCESGSSTTCDLLLDAEGAPLLLAWNTRDASETLIARRISGAWQTTRLDSLAYDATVAPDGVWLATVVPAEGGWNGALSKTTIGLPGAGVVICTRPCEEFGPDLYGVQVVVDAAGDPHVFYGKSWDRPPILEAAPHP